MTSIYKHTEKFNIRVWGRCSVPLNLPGLEYFSSILKIPNLSQYLLHGATDSLVTYVWIDD